MFEKFGCVYDRASRIAHRGAICFADVNLDCEVTFDDLVVILNAWGPCPVGLSGGVPESLLAVWLNAGGLAALESGALSEAILDEALSHEDPLSAFASLLQLVAEPAEEIE